ncbi:MAG: DUF5067 domain-containing protein [Atopobiaceae bacterium]|nr:DUF5067 domain-containing protein [Atopobiaceae bacterium]
MFKQAGKIAAATMLALSLCACGSGANNQSSDAQPAEEQQETVAAADETTEEQEEAQDLEYSVDQNLEYTLDKGSIRFDHVERAGDDLTDTEDVLLFVYDFTNEQDKPASTQTVFWIQYFQNGVELKNSISYNPTTEQGELAQSYYNDALKGGTITFAQIVQPKDDSPITVMVSPNPRMGDEEYPMMVVTFGDDAQGSGSPSDSASASVAAKDVDTALQGTWSMGDDGKWTFDKGSVSFDSAMSMSGTYEIDTDASEVVTQLEATDGTVKAVFPFEYDGKTLTLFKNRDKAEKLSKL